VKFAKWILVLVIAFISTAPAFADTNVALGASVSTSGPGFGIPDPAGEWGSGNYQPNSIANGTPQADGTQWNLGTAFWIQVVDGSVQGGADPNDVLTVTLTGEDTIDSLVLQADNNDDYSVSYLNGSTWTPMYTFGEVGGWGLTTRPTFDLGTPITTHAFEITTTGGDGYYAVGQFEAFGTPASAATPEPNTSILLLSGLLALAFVAMRKRFAGLFGQL